jgi:hypothetical protein
MRFIVTLLLAMIVMVGSASNSYEKENGDVVKIENKFSNMSIADKLEITKQVARKQIGKFNEETIKINNLLVENPGVVYFSDTANLNPVGCPADCAPDFNYGSCISMSYGYCGSNGGVYCMTCVYQNGYGWWTKCSVCHFG